MQRVIITYPTHVYPSTPIPSLPQPCLSKHRTHRAARNGRHVVITHLGGWVIQNTHVESGRNAEARDAREAQIRQLSDRHRHGSVSDDAVCVLAGDFNLRAEEEKPLLNEGWRDAWLWPAALAGEAWTWSGHGHKARFDRFFVHDAQNGVTVERQAIERLSGLWPALSDHVALHAVFARRPGTSAEERTYQVPTTLESSGEGRGCALGDSAPVSLFAP